MRTVIVAKSSVQDAQIAGGPEHRDQTAVARRFRYRHVKRVIQCHVLRRINHLVCQHCAHICQQPSQHQLRRAAAIARGDPRDSRLQYNTDFIHLCELRLRELTHYDTAVRAIFDEPLCSQSAQGFPDWRSTDRQFLAKLSFNQARPRRDSSLPDTLVNGLIGFFGCRAHHVLQIVRRAASERHLPKANGIQSFASKHPTLTHYTLRMSELTESIVEFLTGEASLNPPVSSLDLAKRGFIDCIGVAIAGRGEPVSLLMARFAQSKQSPGEARALLGREQMAVSFAALYGTTAAHALDYDDYAFSNHVSALLVPAILAEGERLGASGADMLLAYIAGFEVWGRIFKREPDHLHSKGWHPTGIFGAVGVAGALSRLAGLSPAETRSALGLACASGGGIMDNFGYHAKPWQGARAAEAGVVAAELARLGVTAGPHALDGDGGLMAALSPNGRTDRQSNAPDLGVDWLSAGPALNIKPHPTVGASQRVIDAAIQVHQDLHPPPDTIKNITVKVSEKHAAVMRLHRPTCASEARFSAEFGVAAGLIAGRVTLRELRDDFVSNDAVQRLIHLTEIETGPDDDPSYPVGARFDALTITLQDGTQLASEPVHRFRGHGDNPMSSQELKDKFEACVREDIGAEQTSQLWEQLNRFEELSSAKDLPTLNENATH